MFNNINSSLSLDQNDVARRLLALQNSTGYEIIQRQGQRIFGGPPPDWKGPVPDKGTEVYCYKIPRDCFEDELVPVFGTVGKIYELRLMIEFSGTNRSYCYVRYTKQEEAREAIQKLNNYMIRPGSFLAVTRSVDNRKLSIKVVPSIPEHIPEKSMRDELGRTFEGVEDVKRLLSGWMEIEFVSHRMAALARRNLVPGNVVLFGKFKVKQVDWADPEEYEEKNVSSNVLTLPNSSVSNLSDVRDIFNEISGGNVASVEASGSYVLVNFKSDEHAKFAYACSKKVKIGDKPLQVKWGTSKRVDHGNYSSVPRILKQNHATQVDPFENLSSICLHQGWGMPQFRLLSSDLIPATNSRMFKGGIYIQGLHAGEILGDWFVDQTMARNSAISYAMDRVCRCLQQYPPSLQQIPERFHDAQIFNINIDNPPQSTVNCMGPSSYTFFR